MATTTRCVSPRAGSITHRKVDFQANSDHDIVAAGGVGEHVAVHHQRRLLFVGEAEKCGPGCRTVQASGEETPAPRNSIVR